ncbi:MAG: hypothetical protein EBZ48_07515, partial [Proteobacteria bacterium]|nr:hypothetical protein [Pseudomonadota bacterium]
MKFRTRILLLFIPAITASISFALFLFWRQSDAQVQFIDHAKALSIATTVAAALDAEAIRAIKTPNDEQSAAYQKLSGTLDSFRRVNRREDTWVQNIYTVFDAPGALGTVLIGVDPETSPTARAHVGEPVRFRSP